MRFWGNDIPEGTYSRRSPHVLEAIAQPNGPPSASPVSLGAPSPAQGSWDMVTTMPGMMQDTASENYRFAVLSFLPTCYSPMYGWFSS